MNHRLCSFCSENEIGAVVRPPFLACQSCCPNDTRSLGQERDASLALSGSRGVFVPQSEQPPLYREAGNWPLMALCHEKPRLTD